MQKGLSVNHGSLSLSERSLCNVFFSSRAFNIFQIEKHNWIFLSYSTLVYYLTMSKRKVDWRWWCIRSYHARHHVLFLLLLLLLEYLARSDWKWWPFVLVDWMLMTNNGSPCRIYSPRLHFNTHTQNAFHYRFLIFFTLTKSEKNCQRPLFFGRRLPSTTALVLLHHITLDSSIFRDNSRGGGGGGGGGLAPRFLLLIQLTVAALHARTRSCVRDGL